MPSSRTNPRQWPGILLLAYAAVLVALLPVQSLWLDEIMELVATRSSALTKVVSGYVLHSAGQAPLGALEQWLSIHAFGFCRLTARLPAAIASLLAIWGMLRLARESGLQRPWLAALILAILPLQIRYATEARPYSQALCVAVWLAYYALQLPLRPAGRPLAAYFVLLVIGLYTQTYLFFIALAHLCWLISVNRKAAVRLALAVSGAAACYAPWYFAAHVYWSQEINTEGLHFLWQAKLPLLILRELLGCGYLGTAAAIALAVYGASRVSSSASRLLVWSAAFPVVLVVVADAHFDYFFAIRQIIIVLPPLALLIAFGFERMSRRPATQVAAFVLCFALCAGYTARWFIKLREDWARAAHLIATNVGRNGCYQPIPLGTAAYYELFEPGLAGRICSSVTMPASVVVAISPYDRDSTESTLVPASLERRGYSGQTLLAIPSVQKFMDSHPQQ